MYKLILPIRYFLKRPMAWMASASVALSVFITLVVMTVICGLVNDFKDKNHQYVGDCVIGTESLVGFAYYNDLINVLEKQDCVESASAVLKTFGFISKQDSGSNFGIEIIGIDPAEYSKVTNFKDTLYYHKDGALENIFDPPGKPAGSGCAAGVIIMYGSTDRNGRYYRPAKMPDIDFLINAFPLTAKGALARKGTDFVSSRSFTVTDDSRSGIVRVDQNAVYIDLSTAQQLTQEGSLEKRVSAIHVKFKDGVNQQYAVGQIEKLFTEFKQQYTDKPYASLFDNVTVQSWQSYCRETVASMEKEQVMLTILFLMLGCITIFIMFVIFYMIIAHKTKDIGILKSCGCSKWYILSMFVNFALIIATAGAGIGTVAGYFFLKHINSLEHFLFQKYNFQVWDRSVYAIGDIPSKAGTELVLTIFLCAIAGCVLGAAGPAIKAANQRAVNLLQVNQL